MNRIRCCLVILAMLCGGQLVVAQGTWEWQSPAPQGATLCDVDMFADGSGITVTTLGSVLRTQNNGESWTLVPAGLSTYISGQSFINSNEGWAYGSTLVDEQFDAHIYHTTDGGFTWVEQAIVTDFNPNDMQFVTANLGFVVGGRYGLGATICRTTDGGESWVRTVDDTLNTHSSLFFLDALNGWIIGYGVLRTTDGGLSWTRINADDTYPERKLLFFDELNGAGISWNSFLRTTDGGVHWTVSPFPGEPGDISTTDMDFTDSNTGWLVGNRGQILTTLDGGQNWAIHAMDFDDYFLGVSAANSQTIIAVGSCGRIVTTRDGGNAWTLTAGQRLTDLWFYSVDFYDENYGWAVGGRYNGGGVIARTANGGSHWDVLVNSPDSSTFRSVVATGPATAWVTVGGTLRKTTNGGESWIPISLPSEVYPSLLQMLDPENGLVIGHSRLAVTTDGGQTWNLAATQIPVPTDGMFFLDVQNGWTFGGKPATINHTTDGGETWTTQYHDSTWGETVALNVWFSDPQNGWAAVWGRCLLHTTNGGETWEEVFIRDDYWGDWAGMSWADADHGWVINDYEPSAYTSDGGVTWTEIPVPTDARQFDCDYPDPNHVWVVGWDGNILKWNAHPNAVEPRDHAPVADQLALSVYPNPFNPQTTLSFTVPQTGRVQVSIYDLTGRLVQTLTDHVLAAGTYTQPFRADHLPSGVYFARLSAAGASTTHKLLLLR